LVRKNKKPTKFEYKGKIWHHLEVIYAEWYYNISQGYMQANGHTFKHLVQPEDIIRRSGSWILTDIKTFEKAYTKAMHIYKYNAYMWQKRDKDGDLAMVEGRPGGVPNSKLSWEEFEVYIEKV
jgi:hypothetical protein